MLRRRLLFGTLPVVTLLAVAEVFGRGAPSELDSTLARLYEPGTVLVAEEGSTRRTAHTELHPQAWEMPAPGFRVAFVGDSTAWGQLPDAFVQGLQAPGQDVEVLNFAMRGAASLRVRVQAEAAVAQDLDLLVVYVGHNEVTEGRLNPFSLEPYWKRRLIATIGRTGLARQMGPLLRPLRRRLELRTEVLRRPGELAIRPLSPEEWAPSRTPTGPTWRGSARPRTACRSCSWRRSRRWCTRGRWPPTRRRPTGKPCKGATKRSGKARPRRPGRGWRRSRGPTARRGRRGRCAASCGWRWNVGRRRSPSFAPRAASTGSPRARRRTTTRSSGRSPEAAAPASSTRSPPSSPIRATSTSPTRSSWTASTPRSPGTCSWPGSSPKRRRSRRAAPGTPLA